MMKILMKLKGGLIVSCQALEDEPLHGPMIMAAMARSAALGGAVGIRTNGLHDVEVCRKITGLPVIGIQKVDNPQGGICITPTFHHAQRIAEAGAEIIAVDCRLERGMGEPLEELIPRIKQELGVMVMADCQTLADAKNARSLGADILSPTFGFLESAIGSEPDFGLLAELVKLGIPVIAEGGYWYPEQVVHALEVGAWAVVVGTAITRPMDITQRFVKAMNNYHAQAGI